MNKKKIILFGCGVKLLDSINELKAKYDVVLIVDNDPMKQETMVKEIPVKSVDCIKNYDFDEIFIMPTYNKMDMIRDCLNLGVDSEKIRCFFCYGTERDIGYVFLYRTENVLVRDMKKKMTFYLVNSSDFIVFQEIFAENVYGVGGLAKNTVCIDIGMNIGLASLYFANMKECSIVYGFEPFAKTFEQAKINIELNEKLKEKIQPLNFALGDKETKININYDADFTGGNSLILNEKCSTQGEIIKTKEASNVISDIANSHVANNILLKIDCEGSEYMIFENLKKNNALKK